METIAESASSALPKKPSSCHSAFFVIPAF